MCQQSFICFSLLTTSSDRQVVQRVATNYNEGQRVVQQMNTAQFFKEWMIAILSMTKTGTPLLQWMDAFIKVFPESN